MFEELTDAVRSLDAVFLESNYNPQMLENGPYPPFLKKRIAGAGGHISNRESAALLALAGKRLEWACLAHLSEHNNTPALAMKTHRTAVPQTLRLFVASRYKAGELLATSR